MKLKQSRKPNSRSNRYGAAAVEAALVLPILIIVSFGSIDVAQYINLAQLVSNSSRVGARVASRENTTTVKEVEDAIVDYLADTLAHVPEETLQSAITVEVKDQRQDKAIPGGKLTSISSGDPISVEVNFNFSSVRWLAGPEYWNHNVQESTTVCRRE